jgi:hypothetical protein
VTARNNMHDLKKELASLRLDDEPPRARRGAWAVITLLTSAPM